MELELGEIVAWAIGAVLLIGLLIICFGCVR